MPNDTRAELIEEYVRIRHELWQLETSADLSVGFKTDESTSLFIALYNWHTKPLIHRRNELHKLIFNEDYTEPPYEGNRD